MRVLIFAPPNDWLFSAQNDAILWRYNMRGIGQTISFSPRKTMSRSLLPKGDSF